MRSLVLAPLLAGLLLTVAVPSAQAICAVDEEGGCDRLRHMLVVEIGDSCDDGAALCLLPQDESLAGAPNDADWAFRVHNGASSAITLQLFAIGFYDEDGEPVTGDRIAAQLLGTVDVPAGETVETDFATQVPANVSHVRVQALSAAGSQAEADGELSNFRIMMMQPVDDTGEEPQGNLDDTPQDEQDHAAEGKDAPAPTFLLVVLALGALAIAAGFRRE